MLVVSHEDGENKYYHTDSAKVKDIRWDLIHAENKKHIKPYEEFIKESFYSEEYLRKKYPTEEAYIKRMTCFNTYAVITPNGEWHEPGTMGWWGITNTSPEQESEFQDSYEERFIKRANPEWTMTIVDCHI